MGDQQRMERTPTKTSSLFRPFVFARVFVRRYLLFAGRLGLTAGRLEFRSGRLKLRPGMGRPTPLSPVEKNRTLETCGQRGPRWEDPPCLGQGSPGEIIPKPGEPINTCQNDTPTVLLLASSIPQSSRQ